jgi:hypothetical protein
LGFIAWPGVFVGAGLRANRLCQPIKVALTHRVRQQAGS